MLPRTCKPSGVTHLQPFQRTAQAKVIGFLADSSLDFIKESGFILRSTNPS